MPEDITVWYAFDTWERKYLVNSNAEELTPNFNEVEVGQTEEEVNTIKDGLNQETGFNRFAVGSRPKPV